MNARTSKTIKSFTDNAGVSKNTVMRTETEFNNDELSLEYCNLWNQSYLIKLQNKILGSRAEKIITEAWTFFITSEKIQI
jgi:hypothetical protein